MEDDVTITTRKGDEGWSSTDGKTRLRKDSDIIEALGSLDELVSVLGWMSLLFREDVHSRIESWQRMVTRISEHLSGGNELDNADSMVCSIEDDIRSFSAPPLRGFVLPGGNESSTRAHLARTICRRAERRVLTAVDVSHVTLPILNRLSDALFVLAFVSRVENDGKQK